MGLEDQLRLFERIALMEAKLASTIEKLNNLVTTVESNIKDYSGDRDTPSILSRVIQLEEFKRGIWWSLGVLYTSMIGVIVTLIVRKL